MPGADDKTRVALSMEVCNIPAMELRGIKLKRLKGDVWQYKRVRLGDAWHRRGWMGQRLHAARAAWRELTYLFRPTQACELVLDNLQL